jgi:hypothetical protein
MKNTPRPTRPMSKDEGEKRTRTTPRPAKGRSYHFDGAKPETLASAAQLAREGHSVYVESAHLLPSYLANELWQSGAILL